MRTIRIGSRDSKLAIIQAQMVASAIKSYDKNIQTSLVLMKTTGDKILDRTLDQIGGKGLFVKELDEALLDNQVDITVHSFKDLPMELNPNLPIVAVSEREDPRDVLLLSSGNTDNIIGCSSKRRSIQLKQLGYKDIKSLRGNVLTRVSKLDAGEYSGIVLAAAGIKRLGLTGRIAKYFETDEILPAACQGILAVQSRSGEDTDYLRGFHSVQTAVIAAAERAFVRELEGGCSSPMAAYAYIMGKTLVLEGMYVDERNQSVFKGRRTGDLEEAEQLGRELANSLKMEAGINE